MVSVSSNIVVLTGAGISAESGLSTFRDPDGLWEKYDFQKLATPEAFDETPALVHEFYNLRRRSALAALPNPAHLALVRLEQVIQEAGGSFLLITQNVDGLHNRAGSQRVLAMHGSILRARCEVCGIEQDCFGDLFISSPCPQCKDANENIHVAPQEDQQGAGRLRPSIVWFGEVPLHLEQIEEALLAADLFVSIGTSGSVYPAAGLVSLARSAGIPVIELNREPSDNAHLFTDSRYGMASEVVPAWVDDIITRG